MENIVIKPQNKAEFDLVQNMMARMGIVMEITHEEEVQAPVRPDGFANDFEDTAQKTRMTIPGIKNLQHTRELLYELMRSGYSRLLKI